MKSRVKTSIKNLTNIVEQYVLLEEHLLVVGDSGIGKTEIISDYLKNRFPNYRIVTLLASALEATDLQGLPVVDTVNNKKKTVFIPVRDLLPSKNEKNILIFDELNRAQIDVLNSILPLFNKQQMLGSHVITGKIIIIGIVNPTDDIGLTELSNALLSRVGIVEVIADKKYALDYLREKYNSFLQKSFISFLEMTPLDMKKYPPRLLEKALKSLSLSEIQSNDKSDVNILSDLSIIMLSSFIGENLAYDFLVYLREADKLNYRVFLSEKEKVKSKSFQEILSSNDILKKYLTVLISAGQEAVLQVSKDDELLELLNTLTVLIQKGYVEVASAVFRKISEVVSKNNERSELYIKYLPKIEEIVKKTL